MVSNLDKKAIINMENTARYQSRSKLNVAFSTADRESAVFVFNITKGSKPLLLSSENVTGHIALKHSDGSFVKDTLHFTEPDINGRLEYYIPNEMLKRKGTVTMQVFITEKGNSNVTVAERIVSFDIQESIVSQISAETKLQYIVEYDELQAIIANRITDIENNMANAEDYVSQLEQAREKGLTDIEIAKTDNIKTLNDLADIRLEEMNSKGVEYSTKFDDDKQYMDDKHQEFKDSVLNSEVVTQGESKEWQKYKLTEEDGMRIRVSDVDPVELDTGFYQTWNTYNMPAKEGGAGSYWNVDVLAGADNTKQIRATLSYEGRVFQKNIHKGEDSGWKELISLPLDEEIETKNSAESRANETLTEANQYTNEQITNQHTVLFEGTASGVGTVMNLSETLDNFIVLYIYGSYPGGGFVSTGDPVGSQRITISNTNITDTRGNGGGIYEVGIQKTNRTKLTISNDVYFDLPTQEGSGADANKYTISKIIGVRK